MVKTINLGKKRPESDKNMQNLGMPPPIGSGISGQMPIPVGRPMTLKRVSPSEREVLEQIGWKDGDPVPENLHEVIDAAKAAQASITENLPPPDGLSMTHPALKIPAAVDISTLSPEKQEHYQQVLHEALAQTAHLADSKKQKANLQVSGAAQGVNDAILAAHSHDEVADDRNASEYASGAPKEEQPELNISLEPQTCPRCGWDVSIKEPPVSASEKTAFLLSVMGGAPYIKPFSLFGGHLTVTLRTLTTHELDQCAIAARKYAKDHEDDPAAYTNTIFIRYRAALQLVEWATTETKITCPVSLASWGQSVGEVAEDVFGNCCREEVAQRTLLNTVAEFNSTVGLLEANVQNPDFWPAIDQPS